MEEIRAGVTLETRHYGDASTAPTLVVWGHGRVGTVHHVLLPNDDTRWSM
jgi:hypothetical protein